MRSRQGFAVAAFCILLAAGAAANADPVTDQISQVLDAYAQRVFNAHDENR